MYGVTIFSAGYGLKRFRRAGEAEDSALDDHWRGTERARSSSGVRSGSGACRGKEADLS